MRILWISRWYPWPADNGSRLRIWHLLEHLSRQHSVHLVSFADRPVEAEHRRKVESICASVTVVPWRAFNRGSMRALLGFFASRPRSVVDTYSPEMERVVAEAAALYHPDVVIASELDSAPYVLAAPGTVRVLDELQMGMLASAVEHAPAGWRRQRARLTLWKSRRYVRDLLAQMDGYTVASHVERRLVQRLTGTPTPVAVVPNGVALPGIAFHAPSPRPNTLIYSGSLTFDANREAMIWFLRNVFPDVLRRIPDATLIVTGSTDGVDLSRLGETEQVRFTGYLPDVTSLRREVAGSWVSVVPLQQGGGTRLKILEALALGTPVVATAKGAEGLELTHGRDLLIANTPAAFADALVAVLRDPLLRSSLSEAGRAAVSARYQWQTTAAALDAFLGELVQEEALYQLSPATGMLQWEGR